MRFGLNLIFLVPGETGGMEVYARELIPRLLAAAPEASFTAFVNREAAEAGIRWDGATTVTVPVQARHRAQWVFGEQVLLPRLARRQGVDLLHSLASTAPTWGRFRRVVTIHDLIYARHPDAHGGARALGMRALVPLAARHSARVIAISRSTRDDLVSLLGTPAEKIDVVPQGLGLTRRLTTSLPAERDELRSVRQAAGPASAPRGLPNMRSRLGLGDRRVLLSLSAKRPHKNLIALIGALAAIAPERRPVLLLPGYPTWHEAELRERAALLDVEGDVRFLDWVSSEELEGLWAIAAAFVYPSLYEGFGLPVLEAMARGVPVACSNASSLPEVAGEAAIMFDPHSKEQIASAIERLLGDQDEALRLREAGVERAAQFTWERTAHATLDVYRRTLGTMTAPGARATPPVRS